MGSGSLNFTYFHPIVSYSSSGQVGGYAQFTGGLVGQGTAIVPASTANTNSISIELLIRPGSDFAKKRQELLFTIGSVYASMSAESINFKTPSDLFSVPLDGIGPKRIGYYLDRQWHHLVFQFNASSGLKEIYVDGTLASGFSKTASPLTQLFAAQTEITLNSNTDYDMYHGDLDELAVYLAPLPATLIQLHHQNRIAGTPYSFIDNPSLPLPAALATTGPLDAKEFAPGTVLPTSSTSVAQGVSVSALDQLKKFPTPRFRSGSGLPRNPSHFSWDYLGNAPNNTASVANQIGGQIYTEMADRWNYYLTQRVDFSTVANFSNTNRPEYYLKQVTQSRPDLPFWGITLRVQNTPAQLRQDLPDACYIRNSSGTPLLLLPPATPTQKRIRPFSSSTVASNAGCPDSNFDADANFVIKGFAATLSQIHPSTVFAGFSDNNEFLYPASTASLSGDPAVSADHTAAGSPGLLQFDSNHFGRLDARFRDLIKASSPRLTNALFQSYQVDTDQGYYWEWTNFRQSFTPWQGHLLATPDFYPRFPNNWRNGYAAWHGLSWMMKARRYQIDHGDSLYSPYSAAGWDADEGKNIRPAQWLGLQKIIYGLGAPYTFPGFYIESAPWPKAEAYIHQVSTPIYAQAVFSHAEDLLLNGQLLDGDVPLNSTDSPSARKGYEFWGGDPRLKIIVRKDPNAARYLIIGTLQPLSSMIGNAELSKSAQITLAGQILQFEVRRQGSIYVFDNRNSSSPIFYQLDSWHEANHPSYWSQNTTIEAELAESGLTSANPELKTELASGNSLGNFMGSKTYVSFPSTQTTFGTGLRYSYRPTDASARTLYILARSKVTGGTGKLGVSVDQGTAVNTSTVSSTSWAWYPVSIPSANSAVLHSIRLLPSNAQVEIDQLVISDVAP